MQKIPFVEASGSNYDIGFTIGKKLAFKIKELTQLEQKDYQKESGNSLSYYAQKINKLVGIAEKYFPDYVEELLGMAEGSGVDFNTLFALGCDDDLIYNCTSLAGFSKEGIILGQNEDWLIDHINSLYICKIEQKGKPHSISLSYVGHLPGFSVGFNSAGFAYAENSLYVKGTNKKGLPLQFLFRANLDVKTYDDLTRIISIRDKMIGGNSLMSFGGKIFDIEFLPQKYEMIKCDRCMAHTNHILNEKIIDEEKRHSRSSLWRLNRADQLLKNNDFSFNLVQKILSDHERKPYSICYHEFEDNSGEPYATIASVIIKMNKKEFYVSHGNPCQAKYNKYRL